MANQRNIFVENAAEILLIFSVNEKNLESLQRLCPEDDLGNTYKCSGENKT